jgi:hypothetical protein
MRQYCTSSATGNFGTRVSIFGSSSSSELFQGGGPTSVFARGPLSEDASASDRIGAGGDLSS